MYMISEPVLDPTEIVLSTSEIPRNCLKVAAFLEGPLRANRKRWLGAHGSDFSVRTKPS